MRAKIFCMSSLDWRRGEFHMEMEDNFCGTLDWALCDLWCGDDMDYSGGSITFSHVQDLLAKESPHTVGVSGVDESLKACVEVWRILFWTLNDDLHVKVRRCINLDFIATAAFTGMGQRSWDIKRATVVCSKGLVCMSKSFGRNLLCWPNKCS